MDNTLKADIRYLCLRKNMSIHKTAKQLGISRKTVRKALQEKEALPDKTSRFSKLDPFKDEITRLLKEFPLISGIRIFEELLKQGYVGKTTILNDYLKTLCDKQKEAFVRLHFTPGQQAQVDWGSCGTIMVEGHPRRLSVFAMVMSYSRMMYLEFTISEKMEDFLRCHVNAFRFFGGVPSQLLYDNLKNVVIGRSGKNVQYNQRFMDFAAYYTFKVCACNVARGNEKGRVESAIKYIKGNFLSGRIFTGLIDIHSQTVRWRDHTANVRTHGSTRKRPVDLFVEETKHLALLPAVEYDTNIVVPVRVSKDCFVKFQTNSYSVPFKYTVAKLTLKAGEHAVRIYHDQESVATHRRCYDKYKTCENPEHFKGLLEIKRRAITTKALQQFSQLGEKASLYMQGLLQTRVNAKTHIKNILKLSDLYGKTAMLDAIDKAITHEAYGSEYIENIILQRRTECDDFSAANTLLLHEINGFSDVVIQPPDLARYDSLDRQGDTNED